MKDLEATPRKCGTFMQELSLNDFSRVLPLKRWSPLETLEQDRTQGIEIGCRCDSIATECFWRRVCWAADSGPGPIGVLFNRSTEIDEFDNRWCGAGAGAREEVLRFDIAMADTMIMEKLKRTADLDEQIKKVGT